MKNEIARLTRGCAHEGLLPRDEHGNKGSFGRLLCVCGSVAMPGAAVLCASAALRCGVGLVRVALPRECIAGVVQRAPEAMFAPLLPNEDGASAACNAPLVSEGCAWASAVLCGCGLSACGDTRTLLLAVLDNERPIVLDADALNLLAREPELLTCVRGAILTPHLGEFARLTGLSVTQIRQSRAQAAQSFAVRHGVTLVLKDSDTVVASPEGELWLYEGRNSGLAKGGSGDVLAGVIASLLAQGVPGARAAAAGVWLHGAAGRIACDKLGEHGMLPHDVIEALPQAILEVLA
ncbi:MAG: NAD(P)H-hydrate dehydratase [Clostridium sp. SCN 57-10]|nr:MAG: NAD(P)H-hydrate dehydratase [Clostridium sp. SCN 57-10]